MNFVASADQQERIANIARLRDLKDRAKEEAESDDESIGSDYEDMLALVKPVEDPAYR